MTDADGIGGDPERRGLFVGILAYRWTTLLWMIVLAVLIRHELAHPATAAVALGFTVAWNVWFMLARGWERPGARWVDLGIAGALLPLSGYVMEPGTVGGAAPFFATSYPASAALTIGAATTAPIGLAAGGVLSLALVASRAVNGVDLLTPTADPWANLVNGIVYYLTAGGAAGLVSQALARAAARRTSAMEEAARERERAARLAERDAMGREIHDSVLQTLALLGKRSRELSRRDVTPDEVRDLLDEAGRQEQLLRSMLSEPREARPSGAVSLRMLLEAAAFGTRDLPVTVSVPAGSWLEAEDADLLSGAVRQALDNAAAHAEATRATVFAERSETDLIVFDP